MLEKVEYLNRELNIKTHALVLMSNHYRWILSTPDLNLSKGMTYFHREVARCANRKSKRINHFFGGRYKWCSIQNELYYWNAVKYVFRNPVKAQICSKVEEYKYSSLNETRTFSYCRLNDFFNNPEVKISLDLDWLNEPYTVEVDDVLRRGLRRRMFQVPKDGSGKVIQTLGWSGKRDLVP